MLGSLLTSRLKYMIEINLPYDFPVRTPAPSSDHLRRLTEPTHPCLHDITIMCYSESHPSHHIISSTDSVNFRCCSPTSFLWGMCMDSGWDWKAGDGVPYEDHDVVTNTLNLLFIHLFGWIEFFPIQFNFSIYWWTLGAFQLVQI